MNKIIKAILFSSIIFLIIILQTIVGNMNDNNFRKPTVAGSFYPENKATLISQLDTFLEKTEI
jgi:hypothetical protein